MPWNFLFMYLFFTLSISVSLPILYVTSAADQNPFDILSIILKNVMLNL